MEEFTREQYYDIVQDIVLKHGIEIVLDKDTVAADQDNDLSPEESATEFIEEYKYHNE